MNACHPLKNNLIYRHRYICSVSSHRQSRKSIFPIYRSPDSSACLMIVVQNNIKCSSNDDCGMCVCYARLDCLIVVKSSISVFLILASGFQDLAINFLDLASNCQVLLQLRLRHGRVLCDRLRIQRVLDGGEAGRNWSCSCCTQT